MRSSLLIPERLKNHEVIVVPILAPMIMPTAWPNCMMLLQALCMTGTIPYAAVLPIIMGQNIGTCITALLSSIGTNTHANNMPPTSFFRSDLLNRRKRTPIMESRGENVRHMHHCAFIFYRHEHPCQKSRLYSFVF